LSFRPARRNLHKIIRRRSLGVVPSDGTLLEMTRGHKSRKSAEASFIEALALTIGTPVRSRGRDSRPARCRAGRVPWNEPIGDLRSREPAESHAPRQISVATGTRSFEAESDVHVAHDVGSSLPLSAAGRRQGVVVDVAITLFIRPAWSFSKLVIQLLLYPPRMLFWSLSSSLRATSPRPSCA